MKRILHYGLTSSLGGIETYLRKITREVDKNKYQFDFLIIGNEKPCFYEELKNYGCNFHYVTPRTISWKKNIEEISKVLDENSYDAVHCHLNTLSYITPARLALKKNINVIIHSRNGNSPKGVITNILHYYNYYTFPFKKVGKLAVSRIAGEWLFHKKRDFKIINNGLNVERYLFDLENRKKYRKELNLNGHKVFINVGALRRQKNHSYLIDVFEQVIKKTNNVKLLLIGEGNLRSDLELRVQRLGLDKDIFFLGNRDDIPQILSAADAFVFPSFYEGFPNALIEAQTNGLSCLMSSEITKEVMVNQNVEVLPITEDAKKDWVKRIVELDPELTSRLFYGKKVRDSGFSVEEEIKKITDIYDELI